MATSEPQSSAAATPPTAEPVAGKSRRPGWRRPGQAWVTLAILLVAGTLVGLFVGRWDVWVGGSSRQTTDDAYIRGDITPLSAKIEGYVRRVPVDDFQRTKKGDLLVEIEDDDYRARVDQAAAALLGAAAAIENLKTRKALQLAQVAEAQDAVSATQADVIRTRQEAARQQALLASTFGTRQMVEQAVADQKRFEANLARGTAALDAAHRPMAVLDTEEAELRADAKAKAAARDLARIELGYTRITAPIDGMVSERGVRAGQYVHDGTQVISVVPLKNVWVVANYKETQLTRVRVGQPAEIAVDTFPGVAIAGRVDEVDPVGRTTEASRLIGSRAAPFG